MAPTIDWSLAPDDATHYDELAEVFCNERGYWCDDNYWRNDPHQVDWGTSRYIPRPVPAWTGEGLPPVGTVCEVLNNTLDRPEWERCTILFMGKFKAVYESESCHERVADVSEDWMISFLPIRTPEQIAADERLHNVRNACTAIADTLDGLRGKTKVERAALAVVEAMIDAGYRKVTGA